MDSLDSFSLLVALVFVAALSFLQLQRTAVVPPVAERRLQWRWCSGLAALQHVKFPRQGIKPMSPNGQVDSYPLYHQGSLGFFLKSKMYLYCVFTHPLV